jgi:hypothetical protein
MTHGQLLKKFDDYWKDYCQVADRDLARTREMELMHEIIKEIANGKTKEGRQLCITFLEKSKHLFGEQKFM